MKAFTFMLSAVLLFGVAACKRADMKVSKSDDPDYIEVTVDDYTCQVPKEMENAFAGPVEQKEGNPYFIIRLAWQDDPNLYNQFAFTRWNVWTTIFPAKNRSDMDLPRDFSYPDGQVGDVIESYSNSGLLVKLKGTGLCSTPDQLRTDEQQLAQALWLTDRGIGRVNCRSNYRRPGDHPFSCSGSGTLEYASLQMGLTLTQDGECQEELIAISEYMHEKLNEVAGYECWDNREL